MAVAGAIMVTITSTATAVVPTVSAGIGFVRVFVVAGATDVFGGSSGRRAGGMCLMDVGDALLISECGWLVTFTEDALAPTPSRTIALSLKPHRHIYRWSNRTPC